MKTLIELVELEIARLQQVRSVLASAIEMAPPKKRGRPAGTTNKAKAAKPTKKRALTAEGRARIAEAMKKRWAAKKKAAA